MEVVRYLATYFKKKFFLAVPGIEPRTSHMLVKCFTTNYIHSPRYIFLSHHIIFDAIYTKELWSGMTKTVEEEHLVENQGGSLELLTQ